MSALRGVGAILWKDLLTEMRTRETLTATILFGVLVVLIFHFAFPADAGFTAVQLAPGCLWVAFAFSGVLSLNRLFVQEKEGQRMHGMLIAPVSRPAIYVAKAVAALVILIVTEAVIFPVFLVFFGLRLGGALPYLLLVFALGTVGFVAVGTLFSAVSANTRMRDVMLPVLLLPVSFPLLTVSVEATTIAFQDGRPDFWRLMGMLVAYDAIFVAVSYVLFEYAIEE